MSPQSRNHYRSYNISTVSHFQTVPTRRLAPMDSSTDSAIGLAPRVTCCLCLEHIPRENTTAVSSDSLCYGCLRDWFQRALDREAHWPPQLKGHLLEPKNFTREGVVSSSFVEAYEQKEKEYKCPVPRRIYCSWPAVPAPSQDTVDQTTERCLAFLGEKVTTSNAISHPSTVCRKC